MNNETQKIGFFKKIWYSIDKIEKYGEMSAEGFPRAISYLFQIIIILAIIVAGTTIYQTKMEIDKVAQFIKDEIPNFTYSNNELNLETDEVITKEQEYLGKVIIDTNQNNEEQIDKYINDIPEETNGVIILKNKIIIKQSGIDGTINYKYEDLVKQLGVTDFNKDNVIKFITGTQMSSIYLSIFSILVMSAISVYFINIMLNIFAISIFGYLATLITKMKMRYIAIFNMAIYSITLPTILQMLYIIANQAFGIQIKYFDVMYILVSCIYMIAAIFILKSDLTKKQEQLIGVVEVQKQIKEEKRENEENKDKQEKKTDKKKSKENEEGQEPEGSKA